MALAGVYAVGVFFDLGHDFEPIFDDLGSFHNSNRSSC
jgi:hypothetical protein